MRFAQTAAGQSAIEKARQALLDFIDNLIAKAPEQYRPGLQLVRDSIATSSALPAELIGVILKALGDGVISGQWGPATNDPTDTA